MLNVSLDENYITLELADIIYEKCNTLFRHDKGYDNIRQCLLYGNKDLIYKTVYNGITNYASTTPWDMFPELITVKEQLENTVHKQFNFCAIMMYANEHVIIKKHRDKEIPMNESICGISVGATRRMLLTKSNLHTNLHTSKLYSNNHNNINDSNINDSSNINGSNINGSKELVLTHGSLYQLLPPTNDFWLHEILPETYPTGIRFSLTFRHIPNAMYYRDIVYCSAKIKTGKNKGNICNCIAYNGKYCGKHKQQK